MSAGTRQEGGNQRGGLQHILLFGLLTVLPGLQSSLFGLLYLFIPLAVLFYFYRWENGGRYVAFGLALGALLSLIFGSIGSFLFTATFAAPGYALAVAALGGRGPASSGLQGTIGLVVIWLVLLAGYSAATGINPVAEFLLSLDRGIEEALNYYRQNQAAAPETVILLEQSFYRAKTALPKVLPGLIAGFAMLVVWFTMLAGNQLISRFTSYRPWLPHRFWQLPDRMVWGIIGSALLALLPLGIVRLIGLNGLIIFCFCYFFQGFSIFSFFLDKWGVPLLLRAFLYGMMLFQSFGTMLLLVVGLGDVWFNLRRLQKSSDQEDSTEEE